MSKKRAKRFSGSLNRYLKNPTIPLQSDKIKVKNPLEEFEKEQEKIKSFVIPASEPKPIQEEKEKEIIIENDFLVEPEQVIELPIYCNHCEMIKICPDGRQIKRVDQKQLIVCKKRNDFRQLIQGAKTNSREGLLAYIHNLRSINSLRIGRLIYKESMTNGHDRNLSLLIDKQIDNSLSEIKLITPTEKNTGSFSFHLTTVHNTVDTYNELPGEIKTYLLSALKMKLLQIKTPKQNAEELLASISNDKTNKELIPVKLIVNKNIKPPTNENINNITTSNNSTNIISIDNDHPKDNSNCVPDNIGGVRGGGNEKIDLSSVSVDEDDL